MSDDKVVLVKEGGGSGNWLIALVLLVAIVIGTLVALKFADSNAAKNDAVSQAAGQVGNAAEEVGDAAQKAAN